MSTPRIRMPSSARPGEVIEIRTLIDHPMETGLRHQGTQSIARRMITRFEVSADGQEIFAADLRNGTSANPYHIFFARFERSTTLSFLWREEDGREHRASQALRVG
jgi:sulfur-oxidizing protein SoxZ